MKLYSDVARIHRELATLGIGPDAALRVDQLTAFDQYHYFGTEAIDEALAVLDLKPGSRVLDVGSGIGGPARYIASQTGARVTALELQADLHEVGSALTARCGLSDHVDHVCGDILSDDIAGNYDAIISFLCFLHIPDRAKLLANCRRALKPGGVMYIEDYAKPREHSDAERQDLLIKVQCPFLPSLEEYTDQLEAAGFGQVQQHDVTAAWADFTTTRLEMFRLQKNRNVTIHGSDTVNGLDDFYATVAGLFQNGAIDGLKVIAC